ncbi:MAG: hypothetical protein QOG64_2751 [Acidimicrobiaceae bacterium]|nr:hypothetical protein [Acidimicrobiaceae bacterium]
MIFGSFGLLVVAVAMLIAAIVKSSVGFGIGSLICTVLAGVLLLVANAYYRKLTLDAQRGEGGELGDSQLRRMASGGAPTLPAATPMAQGAAFAAAPGQPTMAMAGAPAGYAGGNGHGGGGYPVGAAPFVAPPASVIEGFDSMNATQAASMVETLGLDDLHALRRWEIEHAARKTVLTAIDKRTQTIVDLRKQVTSFEG